MSGSSSTSSAIVVPQLPSSVPFPIDDALLQDVVVKAKDWALMHGAGMRSKANFNPNVIQFAPFILTPTAFPRREFEKAVGLQTILNELMHWVAHDAEFLRETLANTVLVDEFTGNLFRIYERTLKEGVGQPISLGMIRSDLMLESQCVKDAVCQDSRSEYCCCWKQVEINTIASGFGHLGPISRELQSYILQELGHGDKLKDLPANRALAGLCEGMIEAWRLQAIPAAAILFVIEDVTYNICDQRFHEFYIREHRPDIRVLRKSLTQIHEQGSVGAGGELLIDGTVVTVVYFRAGYEPGHYHGAAEWDARWLLERSAAIKCPSIHYHLAGTKKVQQALARPGVLSRFIADPDQVRAISEIFTGLFSLDDRDAEGAEAIRLALANPAKYVLKPQREGGGNNVYDADIPAALAAMSALERSAWILMERIFPPISRGYMVRPDGPASPEIVDLVSELGIFGVIIGDKDKIVYNRQAGHMLRTKLSSSNEGGVAAGMGALDSPYLID